MTILIIEDDTGISELLKERVDEAGYHSVCLSTGEEALRFLKGHTPHLMVLDYSLPDMTGQTFIETLMKTTKPLPAFIVSTGHGSEHIAVDMMRLGARDYIVKDSYFLEKVPAIIKRVYSEAENEKKRKQAEAALRMSEEKYRHLFENLYDVYYQTDAEGRITLISPSVERDFGYHPKDLIGRDIKEIYVDAGDREIFLSQLLSSGHVNNFEARMKRKDRTEAWVSTNASMVVDDKGRFAGVEGNTRDITERKQTEDHIQALLTTTLRITGTDFYKKSAKKLCEWLDCDIAILGELQNHKRVNVLAMQSDGESIEEHTYDIEGTPCQVVMKHGFKTYPENVAALFPDNTQLAEMNISGYVGTPLIDSNRNTIGIFCAMSRQKLILPKRAEEVMNVIAARVSAEIERERMEAGQKTLQTQLQQVQKMESIGTLAGGIAHDFNNILFPILGHTEILLEDVAKGSLLRDSLEEIYSGALRAKDLIKQILTFSRQENSELKPMRVQFILKEALKLIRSSIPTTIKIKQEVSEECGLVRADPTQLHQVIMNLTTNAYHAMEETGGEMRIQLSEVELDRYDLKNLHILPGAYICLTVADTGMGMDDQIREKIFDPFFTTKEKGKGTGMGLSVVHGIVTSMGGSIRVSSTPGLGTEFNIYFPKEKKFSEQKTPISPASVRGGTEHILVVDDEAVIVKMIKQTLERMGYQISTRTSSLDALEAFSAAPDRYDLVITDMTMPNMSGDRLSAELIKIRRDIPILICTGFSEKLDRQAALAIGIKGLLIKPIIKYKMARIIRKVLDEPEALEIHP